MNEVIPSSQTFADRFAGGPGHCILSDVHTTSCPLQVLGPILMILVKEFGPLVRISANPKS